MLNTSSQVGKTAAVVPVSVVFCGEDCFLFGLQQVGLAVLLLATLKWAVLCFILLSYGCTLGLLVSLLLLLFCCFTLCFTLCWFTLRWTMLRYATLQSFLLFMLFRV